MTPAQIPTRKTIDFSHRLSLDSDDSVMDSRMLTDTISMMTGRVIGVTVMLGEMIENDILGCMSPQCLHGVLYSIINELHDIDAVVLAFNEGMNTMEQVKS